MAQILQYNRKRERVRSLDACTVATCVMKMIVVEILSSLLWGSRAC